MTYVKTLAQLRSSVQTRWQLDNSPDLGNAANSLGIVALNEMINDAIVELHDILVEKWADYKTTSSTFATTPNVNTYDLQTFSANSDFYKLRKVELAQGTRWRRLLPHDLDASHHFVALGPGDRRYRYRVMDGLLIFEPPPTAVETIRIWYIKSAPQLVNDSDTYTFPVPVAQKLLLALVGADVLDRQDRDTTPAEKRIARLTDRLQKAADGIDASEPFYIDPDGPPPEYEEDIFY